MHINISVILHSLDHASLTLRCLEALSESMRARSAQWIIIYDDLSPEAREVFQGRHHVKFVSMKRQKTAEACNSGLALAEGNYILIIRCDVIFSPQSLDRLFEVQARAENCGLLGIDGGWVLPDGKVIDATLWPLRPGLQFDYMPVGYVSGYCLLFSRDFIRREGIKFDAEYPFQWYDVDFSRQIKLAGKSIYMVSGQYARIECLDVSDIFIERPTDANVLSNESRLRFINKFKTGTEKEPLRHDVFQPHFVKGDHLGTYTGDSVVNVERRVHSLPPPSTCSQEHLRLLFQHICPDMSMEEKIAAFAHATQMPSTPPPYPVSHDVIRKWSSAYHKRYHTCYHGPGSDEADYSTVALISARGGSTGLPGKALRLLDDAPLIAHTIRPCLSSGTIKHILVTTDSPEIRAAAVAEGAWAPFLRPSFLATNDVGLDEVANHALYWLQIVEGIWPRIVLNLTPTYPFRSSDELDFAVRALEASASQSLVSLSPVPNLSGKSCFTADADKRQPVLFYIPSAPVYAKSGFISITHMARADAEPPVIYFVPERYNIDVDTIEDFDLCRCLFSSSWHSDSSLRLGASSCHIPGVSHGPVDIDGDAYPELIVLIRVKGMDLEPSKGMHAVAESLNPLIIVETGDPVVFRENGFPVPDWASEMSTRYPQANMVCVLDASSVFPDSRWPSRFIREWRDGDRSAWVSASMPPVHPYWLKVLHCGRPKPAVESGAAYGQRQRLPPIYVEDGIIRLALLEDIMKNSFPVFGYCLTSDRYPISGPPIQQLRARISSRAGI